MCSGCGPRSSGPGASRGRAHRARRRVQSRTAVSESTAADATDPRLGRIRLRRAGSVTVVASRWQRLATLARWSAASACEPAAGARSAAGASLQLRVVATRGHGIGVLSSAIFLVNQISAGVLRAKRTPRSRRRRSVWQRSRHADRRRRPRRHPRRSNDDRSTSAQSHSRRPAARPACSRSRIESTNAGVAALVSNSPDDLRSSCAALVQRRQPRRPVRAGSAARTATGSDACPA